MQLCCKCNDISRVRQNSTLITLKEARYVKLKLLQGGTSCVLTCSLAERNPFGVTKTQISICKFSAALNTQVNISLLLKGKVDFGKGPDCLTSLPYYSRSTLNQCKFDWVQSLIADDNGKLFFLELQVSKTSNVRRSRINTLKMLWPWGGHFLDDQSMHHMHRSFCRKVSYV